jgi:uncharacterized membrane protein YedE/YeeE
VTHFDPISALLGGALIGLAAALLMLLLGRIAGISGIVAGCLDGDWAGKGWRDKGWRIAFIIGLIAPPLIGSAAGFSVPAPQMPSSWILIAASGLLVGFGTRLGGGCTSGHGVCGIARLSPRSIAATVIFMVSAVIVVAIMRHGIGG